MDRLCVRDNLQCKQEMRWRLRDLRNVLKFSIKVLSIKRVQMDISINFLLQTTRVLHVGNYNDEELEMIYNFISKVDKTILFHYLSSKTILSYDSDLELCLEVVNTLISIYEDKEEYEKCVTLTNKKDKIINILNT